MLAVEFHAASPPPGLDPLLVPLRRISLGVVLEWRHDSWKWFEAPLALLQVRLRLQRWCASMLQILELQMISLDKSALQHFFLEGGGGAVKLPSSQWQADRSHSGIQVPLRVLIRRLGALSTLTYRGFISWPVGFLSESGSGMICILTSQSFSDGEVVFFLYDQINLTRAKGGKRKKKWDLKFPSSLSGGAQLQCILFSIRVVQLQSWELQVERRAKTRQKWLIFIGT